MHVFFHKCLTSLLNACLHQVHDCGRGAEIRKGGVVKGPTILPSSHYFCNLALVTTERSKALFRLGESMAHRSPTKLMRKPKLIPSIRYCVKAGL